MTPLEWAAKRRGQLRAARLEDLPANMYLVRKKRRDRRLMALVAHKAEQPEQSAYIVAVLKRNTLQNTPLQIRTDIIDCITIIFPMIYDVGIRI